jgi:putative SOS response-associated peptidase YedK
MCVRFALFGEQTPELPLCYDWKPQFNLGPLSLVSAVRMERGVLKPEAMILGMKPVWAKSLMLNARSERVLESPAFFPLFRSKRCILPCNGYFEWQDIKGGKQPYYFRLAKHAMFGLAAVHISNQELGVEECVILTTRPNDMAAKIHDRMPCIIPPDRVTEYLTAEIHDAQALAECPFPEWEMLCYPVHKAMGRAGYESPENVVPITL